MTEPSQGWGEEICPRTGKTRHPNEASARQALKTLRLQFKYRGEVYFCRTCEGWHVGRKRAKSGELFGRVVWQRTSRPDRHRNRNRKRGRRKWFP